MYSGSSHALHWEQPERFAADVANLADRVAR
jgi:pimeloyl-ACP methyl ester carboxylesterase